MGAPRTGVDKLLHDHGDVLVATPLRILITIVTALVIRGLAHRSIDRLTRATGEGSLPRILAPLKEHAAAGTLFDGGVLLSERRRQRADTIGSVLKSSVSVVILAMTVLVVLGELDIDVTALIAGTSIVGVALGFGAQNIVKDFLAGIFMILEDQYGVGDFIDVKEATGVVEAVGLRTTRIRDEYGTVWYMRNGEIVRVGNQSQGFSQVVLDVPVAAGADVAAASAAILEVARQMHTDADWAEVFLDDPELQGIEEMTREQTVIRLVARVRPLQQWRTARELRSRIRARLDAQADAPAPPTGAAAQPPGATG